MVFEDIFTFVETVLWEMLKKRLNMNVWIAGEAQALRGESQFSHVSHQ